MCNKKKNHQQETSLPLALNCSGNCLEKIIGTYSCLNGIYHWRRTIFFMTNTGCTDIFIQS